jgi:membrane protein YdbS with pleckstrin-like domain
MKTMTTRAGKLGTNTNSSCSGAIPLAVILVLAVLAVIGVGFVQLAAAANDLKSMALIALVGVVVWLWGVPLFQHVVRLLGKGDGNKE